MATFTTIATGVSLAAGLGTTGMSFAQAASQRKMQRKAEEKAAEMMAEARKRLDVNVYEAVGIAKEPYELQREALLTQGATALQAGQEGEGRGAAATAGRVQMAQQAGQAQTRAAMSQELMDLEKLTAAEEGRLLDVGTQMDLAEVSGAQLAARDAQEAANLATEQGMQGIVQTAGQLASFAPLYEKGQVGRMTERIMKSAKGDQELLKRVANASGVDLSGATSDVEIMDILMNQNPDVLKNINSKVRDLYGSFMPSNTTTVMPSQNPFMPTLPPSSLNMSLLPASRTLNVQ